MNLNDWINVGCMFLGGLFYLFIIYYFYNKGYRRGYSNSSKEMQIIYSSMLDAETASNALTAANAFEKFRIKALENTHRELIAKHSEMWGKYNSLKKEYDVLNDLFIKTRATGEVDKYDIV